jgi:hypothetical protein
MTTTQKIIKYLAVALAVFLIVSIISGIVSAVLALGRFLTNDDNYKLDNYKTLEVSKDFAYLEVDINSANIFIKEGIEPKIETNNKNVYTKIDDKKLIVRQTKEFHIGNKIDSDVIIYLPKDYNLVDFILKSGAGRVEIANINASKVDINLGAGKAIMDNINATGIADIDGGAGAMEIYNSVLHNLDLDMGAGKLDIEAVVTGHSDIDCGVGEANIKLLGSRNDYRLKVSKGLGSLTINGESYGSETTIGDGENYIDIDGGVGAIKINYSE